MARADYSKGMTPHAASASDRGICGPESVETDTLAHLGLAVDRFEAGLPSWETAWIDLGGEG